MLVPFRWTLLYFVTMHSTWLRDLYRWCSVIEFFGPALLHSIIAQKERFVKYRIALHGILNHMKVEVCPADRLLLSWWRLLDSNQWPHACEDSIGTSSTLFQRQ